MNRLATAALLAPGLALASDSTEFAGFRALVPIAVVGTVFGFTAVMIGIIVYAVHRNQRLRHETIRLALEKGQPLPADLLDGGAAGAARAPGARDLRRGLVLLAIGLGLGLFLFFAPTPGTHPNTWSVGFIPGLMGLAYLATYAIGQRQLRGTPTGRE